MPLGESRACAVSLSRGVTQAGLHVLNVETCFFCARVRHEAQRHDLVAPEKDAYAVAR